jgi:hypothetical protein
MAYPAEQKAMALAIVERHGGEITGAALDEVRAMLELPKLAKSTVWQWVKTGVGGGGSGKIEPNRTENKIVPEKKDKRQPTVEMVEAAEESLDKLYERVARRYLEQALKPTVIGDLDGKQAVTAAAIATDKMRLLQGLPTEIIGVLPGIIESANLLGLNASQLLVQMKQRLDAEVASRAVLN